MEIDLQSKINDTMFRIVVLLPEKRARGAYPLGPAASGYFASSRTFRTSSRLDHAGAELSLLNRNAGMGPEAGGLHALHSGGIVVLVETKVQSLDRAFDILELLSGEPNGLSITDISTRLELHKSTVFRLLSALRQRGYIEQNQARGIYRMGMGFLDLASGHLNSLELKTEAEPFLRQLSAEAGQTVYLATLQEGAAVYIDKYEQFDSIRKYSIIGKRRPLHCTSLGKALLTGFSDSEIHQHFAGKRMESRTPKTITDVDSLVEDIRLSRSRGWSFDNEEFELGEQCIGAPVFDYTERVVAAVSTTWKMGLPAGSPPRDPLHVAELVLRAAHGISERMGYRDRWIRKRSASTLGYGLQIESSRSF